jgi:hypothetical protein
MQVLLSVPLSDVVGRPLGQYSCFMHVRINRIVLRQQLTRCKHARVSCDGDSISHQIYECTNDVGRRARCSQAVKLTQDGSTDAIAFVVRRRKWNCPPRLIHRTGNHYLHLAFICGNFDFQLASCMRRFCSHVRHRAAAV